MDLAQRLCVSNIATLPKLIHRNFTNKTLIPSSKSIRMKTFRGKDIWSGISRRVIKSLPSEIFRHLNFIGKNDWSMNSRTPRVWDYQRYFKTYLHFQNATKNEYKTRTTYKTKNAGMGPEKLFCLVNCPKYISNFQRGFKMKANFQNIF